MNDAEGASRSARVSHREFNICVYVYVCMDE